MRLKPNCAEEYQQRHNDIWPELTEVMTAQGVRTYSIFRSGLVLLAYMERQQPPPAGAAHPVIRQWWHSMQPLMFCNEDGSPLREDLHEVFHFEPRER